MNKKRNKNKKKNRLDAICLTLLFGNESEYIAPGAWTSGKGEIPNTNQSIKHLTKVIQVSIWN